MLTARSPAIAAAVAVIVMGITLGASPATAGESPQQKKAFFLGTKQTDLTKQREEVWSRCLHYLQTEGEDSFLLLGPSIYIPII
jgi:hypothetical protein